MRRTRFVLPAVAIAVLSLTAPAEAAQCRSVGGHINGKPVQIIRKVEIRKGVMTLAGKMDGKTMPTRKVPCTKMATGYYCELAAGPVYITTVTNGRRMIETVNRSDTKEEQAGIAYECSAAFR